jgi:hypothetical protein
MYDGDKLFICDPRDEAYELYADEYLTALKILGAHSLEKS